MFLRRMFLRRLCWVHRLLAGSERVLHSASCIRVLPIALDGCWAMQIWFGALRQRAEGAEGADAHCTAGVLVVSILDVVPCPGRQVQRRSECQPLATDFKIQCKRKNPEQSS